ncbi:MAG: hypothetical protein IPJ13_00720 [Saprospiraceae bacterium]|nr:hypothetical protein [Saprospiraceae bacterium]
MEELKDKFDFVVTRAGQHRYSFTMEQEGIANNKQICIPTVLLHLNKEEWKKSTDSKT